MQCCKDGKSASASRTATGTGHGRPRTSESRKEHEAYELRSHGFIGRARTASADGGGGPRRGVHKYCVAGYYGRSSTITVVHLSDEDRRSLDHWNKERQADGWKTRRSALAATAERGNTRNTEKNPRGTISRGVEREREREWRSAERGAERCDNVRERERRSESERESGNDDKDGEKTTCNVKRGGLVRVCAVGANGVRRMSLNS